VLEAEVFILNAKPLTSASPTPAFIVKGIVIFAPMLKSCNISYVLQNAGSAPAIYGGYNLVFILILILLYSS
jgi:hypothetical protein